MIGLQFLGMFVSLDLDSRNEIPCVNHCGFISEFIMALLKQLVMFSRTESKLFNQKSGILSIPISTFVLSQGLPSLRLL